MPPQSHSKKTLHSLPFFALLLTATFVWVGLAYQAAIHVAAAHAALIAWAAEAYTGLFYCALILACLFVLVPLLLLTAWAAPRVSLRFDRIMRGDGWGGWMYLPAAPTPASARQALLRRYHLCWQIPLAWLAAASWAVLADTQGGWNLNGTEPLSILWFLLSMLGMVLLLLAVPARLAARAFPDLRRTIQEYMKTAYPGLRSKQTAHQDTAADDAQAPSADLQPYEDEGEDENTDSATPPTRPAREVHDYTKRLKHAQVPAQTQQQAQQQTQKERKRRTNLKINLLWQTPILLLSASAAVAFGFDHTIMTPLHIIEGRDAVEISVLEPLLFGLGATLLPVWLIGLWLGAWASPKAKAWWDTRLARNMGRACGVLAGCLLVLLPAQFFFLPKLGYAQCNRMQWRSYGSSIPVPAPMLWVKPDSAQARGCRLLR